MYTASTLPAQFHAKPHVSAIHLDLSRIPRTTMPIEWLQPGDSITVSIASGVETGEIPSWAVAVDSDGSVALPLVGRVQVAGLTPNTAAQQIRDQAVLRGLYRAPNVAVNVVQKRTYQVSVVGAVNKPSNYDIPVSNCDLLTALSMAEGLSVEAEPVVEIRHTPAAIQSLALSPPIMGPAGPVMQASFRPGENMPQVVRIDLGQVDSLNPSDLKLLDGSVVSVTRRTRRLVNVLGLVNQPRSLEMPDGDDLSLLEAIAQAGGPRFELANKVRIVRMVPQRAQPITIEATLSDARNGGPGNLVLAPGDIVTVVETPTTIALDFIRTFFRVGFTSALPGL